MNRYTRRQRDDTSKLPICLYTKKGRREGRAKDFTLYKSIENKKHVVSKIQK